MNRKSIAVKRKSSNPFGCFIALIACTTLAITLFVATSRPTTSIAARKLSAQETYLLVTSHFQASYSPIATPAPTAPASLAADSLMTPLTAISQTLPTANDVANLRAGPGTDNAILGAAQSGQRLTVVGRNRAGDWLQLDGGLWIAAFLVDNAPAQMPVTAD